MISLLTGFWIGQLTISLIALLNLIQQRSLSSSVVRTKLLGALKHQVLQVVSQACCLCRIVLTTGTHSYIGLNTWFLRIDGEIYSQSVVKGVDTCLHHIPLNGFILILLGLYLEGQ